LDRGERDSDGDTGRNAKANGKGKGRAKSTGRNVAVLNMASPLSPGGGILNGATGPEETLCMRTTLYPALRNEFYRLPEVGGVWTEDVWVFRDEKGAELPKGSRWWVDVLSAGMLRFPDVEDRAVGEGEEVREVQRFYVNERDREMVVRKIRFVLGVLKAKGIERAVFGAWGCGALGNPVGEVARAFRKVVLGDEKDRRRRGTGKVEGWGQLKEVVFAIRERNMAREFARWFGEGVEVEDAVRSRVGKVDEEAERAREAVRELEGKIRELDVRLEQLKNPAMKAPLEAIRAGLRQQLEQMREGMASSKETKSEKEDGEDEGEDEEDFELVAE